MASPSLGCMGFHFIMLLVVIFVALSMHAMASAAPVRQHAGAKQASLESAPRDLTHSS